MYLARIFGDKSISYCLRETYRADGIYRSRDLFDLGPDPGKFILYPGGFSFYIDDLLFDRLGTGTGPAVPRRVGLLALGRFGRRQRFHRMTPRYDGKYPLPQPEATKCPGFPSIDSGKTAKRMPLLRGMGLPFLVYLLNVSSNPGRLFNDLHLFFNDSI